MMENDFEYPDYVGKYISNCMYDEMMYVTSQTIEPYGEDTCCRLQGVVVEYYTHEKNNEVKIECGDRISWLMFKDGRGRRREVTKEEFFRFLRSAMEKCELHCEDLIQK